MPGPKITETLSNHTSVASVDPEPFAAGREWRQEGETAKVQRVLHAGRSAWLDFAPTAVEFAVIALGLENDRPSAAVLENEIGPQFWEVALGIALPGSYALPDPSFAYAFMRGVLSESR